MGIEERKRLAAILGMLGSNSAGERDNAARMAEEFRRQHRLTWNDLLNLPPLAPAQSETPRAAPHPWVVHRPAWYEVVLTSVDGVTLAYGVVGVVIVTVAIIRG